MDGDKLSKNSGSRTSSHFAQVRQKTQGNAMLPHCSNAALQTCGQYDPYLIAIGLIGEPTAPGIGSGGAQKKNSYTPSAAQSSASSLR
jgi:hypothetical protein